MSSKVKVKQSKQPRKGRTSTSRISAKHQVTVPVDILRAIGLQAGDAVKFEVKAGAIVIKGQDNQDHPLGHMIGAGTDVYSGFDLAKEREAMWPR